MKRIITLMMALALVFGAVANSSAADIKAKGNFQMGYQWTDNTNFAKGGSTDANGNVDGDDTSEDDFVALQRFRTQIDITANENLNGVVYFEIDQVWGRSTVKAGTDAGGALGADGVNVETKRAYIDWTVPNTALSVRMGIQGLALPGMVAGSPILDNDVAAIVTTYKFNDMFSMNAFWARPYDTTAGNAATAAAQHDELDLFGLIAGIKLDGMEFTPYAMYAAVGADTSAVSGLQSLWGANKAVSDQFAIYSFNGSSVAGAEHLIYNSTENLDDSNAYWLGLGVKVDMFDPIVLKLDAVYGNVNGGEETLALIGGNNTGTNATIARQYASDDDVNDRAGWLVAAKVSYKMDMVTPGLIAWVSSGEDDDVMNGSERLPVVSPSFTATSFGFDGQSNLTTGDIFGLSPEGTWALGLLLEDIKVIDSLTSQLRVVYLEGTNDAGVLDSIARHTGKSKARFLRDNIGTFLTDKDNAWEVNFDHKYQIYENLAMIVEMGYINLDLDDSTWGITNTSVKYDEDAYKLGFNFMYTF